MIEPSLKRVSVLAAAAAQCGILARHLVRRLFMIG